jgi:DNA polymerase III delta prime subunit
MIEPGATYWYVNRPADLDAAALPEYVAQGRWQSPTPDTHRAKLESMQAGASIALKSLCTRVSDLPFFTGDNAASVMTIHATGTVTAVDARAGVVEISWNLATGDREWFFWTGIPSLWPVTAGKQPMADRLLAFTFDGAAQDLQMFLGDPYWSPRFAPAPGFSWIPFYQEVATRLLVFQNDRRPIVEGLLNLSKTQPNLAYLATDQFITGESGPVDDVDPFTVMGTFSRGLTLPNRQAVAKAVGGLLGVKTPVMDDIDGVPLLNNMKSWFVNYARDRSVDDIPALWRAFAAGLAHADDPTPDTREELVTAYDEALQVSGVHWNLSVGLYWARPYEYIPLDAQSRAFLASRYRLSIPTDGDGYLRLRDELRILMREPGTSLTTFPEVSHAAWRTGRPAEVPRSMEGLAHWAMRLDESVDLNEIEHDFKRHAAQLAAQARDQAHAGDVTWPTSFKRALNATSTIDFRFKDTVIKAIANQPGEMLAALDLVWNAPVAGSLDALQDELRRLLGRVTPGNATALGALLLMADTPEVNAPYSATRTEKWYQITNFSGSGWTTSASARYQTLLDFLDAFRAKLSLPISRLEAQGMAWAATENEIPAMWSQPERAALEAWRRGGSEPPRAWLVRSKLSGWADWSAEGCVSLGAAHLNDAPPGADLKTVTKAVEAGFQHVDYTQRQALAREYHAFLSRMRPSDVVLAQVEDHVQLGRITGEATYVDGAEDRLRRAVIWLGGSPRSRLSAQLRGALDVQGTVVDLTEHLEELEELPLAPINPPPPPPPPPGRLVLPAVTPAVADSLHCDVEPLQEIVDLLADRKQVVLYGPPGTGKTYIALALAEHLVGAEDSSHRQLVQFHPSYSYEDFFEGFRPYETESGQASFQITPGPLRLIASAAKQSPTKPFVLIIDEMNRANLAKVFGELYFLLEYRDRSIQLQYSPTEAFQLPDNLFIIGTMNTADRSIALLDAAMRRRFSFVELHPEEPPVRDVLHRYLQRQGASGDRRAALLTALNAAIEDTDRDFKIGPSYLMRAEAQTNAGLERIWRHDILPLLEEHYYGRLTRAQVHERFGLASLHATLARAGSHELTPPTSPESAHDGRGAETIRSATDLNPDAYGGADET